MLFKFTVALKSVCDINMKLLKRHNIKALILDLDNTLTTHDNPKPTHGVLEWISLMKKNNIKLIIVSNNDYDRVKPFAELLGIDFIPNGKKPLSRGFDEAQKRMNISFSKIAVVGDQIFTDILGANLKGLTSFFVFPIENEKKLLFKIKRVLEKPFLPKDVSSIYMKNDKKNWF